MKCTKEEADEIMFQIVSAGHIFYMRPSLEPVLILYGEEEELNKLQYVYRYMRIESCGNNSHLSEADTKIKSEYSCPYRASANNVHAYELTKYTYDYIGTHENRKFADLLIRAWERGDWPHIPR